MLSTIIFGTHVTIRVLMIVRNIYKLKVSLFVIFDSITTKRKVGKS